MKPLYAYSCFGLRIRSALTLPELAGVATPADDGADEGIDSVEIGYGSVPTDLPGSLVGQRDIQVGDRDVLLTVKNIARYLVRGGNEIVIDPIPGGSDRDVRLYLLGSALGILCHQRGLLPLHANAIVANGQTFAFAGNAGVGKSTLAAYFQRAGYEVLCDDVCIISFDDSGRPLAWPGLPRLKLWSDAAESFGHDHSQLERAVEGLEKFHVPFDRIAGKGPYPFRRLYLLEKCDEGVAGQIAPLHGMAAMNTIVGQTYRENYLGPMGLRQRNLAQCAALLRDAEVYRASRRWGYDVFEREAKMLERHMLDAAIAA